MLAIAMLLAGVVPSGAVRAQDPPEGREATAQERQAAADAFDRGTRAYLARDYERAAQWFETAYRMAPAAAALVQAVRAHERAGNVVRAATLALRLEVLHSGDRDADRQGQQTLRRAGELVRIDVVCDAACTVELDGTLLEHPSFFVAPATDHVVRASFATGHVEQVLPAGQAGERRELRFEAPPPPPPEAVAVVAEPEPAPVVPPSESPREPEPPRDEGGGLSPAIAVTGIALTAISGGVLIWSGVDTLDGVPAYEAEPSPERLADGQARELRTNVLIGVTGGLALATLVLALVTDWDGASSGEQVEVRAVIVPRGDGVEAMVGGTF